VDSTLATMPTDADPKRSDPERDPDARPAPEGRPGSGARAAFEAGLARAARADATVLLVGESGVGKTRAAARLHAAGPRADGPFVAVHLGSISPTLIESELFGHVRGAFTDARADRAGAFRRAEGGTLVLDDVDLLPAPLQVKLLRAVQEREVEPVGGEGPVAFDVRLVATTNADLAALVRAGSFRQDLFFRLAVVVLEVPPLRARTDELPELAAACLAQRAARAKVPARPLSGAALERLAAHPWPGNVRELENALERVCVLGPTDPGAPADAPIEAAEFAFLDEPLAGEARRLAREALGAGVTSEALEIAMIEEALDQHRGNASAAARAVGLTRRALEYRLERATARQDAERDGAAAEDAPA